MKHSISVFTIIAYSKSSIYVLRYYSSIISNEVYKMISAEASACRLMTFQHRELKRSTGFKRANLRCLPRYVLVYIVRIYSLVIATGNDDFRRASSNEDG